MEDKPEQWVKADKGAETCKICARKYPNRCLRHSKKTIFRTIRVYNQKQLDQALSSQKTEIREVLIKHRDNPDNYGRAMVAIDDILKELE